MVLHRIAVVSAFFVVSATAVLAQTASPQQGRGSRPIRCRCLRTSAPRFARS